MRMTTLELTAVRVKPNDAATDALDRVQELEGEPIDDMTWHSMVALARMAVGGGPETQVEEDRKWGSAKAVVGQTTVDVLWHGNAAYIYYNTGMLIDDQFYAVLQRLRDSGFTIAQGSAVTEVPPSASVADMVAAQRADIGD
jgi:hypothetical protein